MISIIIIVKNDKNIEKTLYHLEKINKPQKTEILVIDASGGLLDTIKNQYPFVKWIFFYNSTNKKITIPEQRNLGVKKSRGKIIVFLDAGCVPRKNWLINISEHIFDKSEYIVAGKTLSEGKTTIRDLTSKLNSGKKYLEECPTINLAIKKDVFDKIGLFDETFECGEDIDFSWRAVDAGYKIRYVGNALVTHNWGTWQDEIKRSFWYGTGRTKLYQKHKNRIKYLFTHDIVMVVYPIYILGLLLTFRYPFYPLLIIIPLIRNRHNKPLHVVIDHLAYGLGVLKELFF